MTPPLWLLLPERLVGGRAAGCHWWAQKLSAAGVGSSSGEVRCCRPAAGGAGSAAVHEEEEGAAAAGGGGGGGAQGSCGSIETPSHLWSQMRERLRGARAGGAAPPS